jgi:hypothetical protein
MRLLCRALYIGYDKLAPQLIGGDIDTKVAVARTKDALIIIIIQASLVAQFTSCLTIPIIFEQLVL